MSQSREHDISKLTTRDQLKVAVAELRGEIQSSEAKLTEEIASLRGEFAIFKEEIRGELKAIRGEIASSQYHTLKWIIPFLITILVAIFFKI